MISKEVLILSSIASLFIFALLFAHMHPYKTLPSENTGYSKQHNISKISLDNGKYTCFVHGPHLDSPISCIKEAE